MYVQNNFIVIARLPENSIFSQIYDPYFPSLKTTKSMYIYSYDNCRALVFEFSENINYFDHGTSTT